MAELVDVDTPYAVEMTVVTMAKVPILGMKRIVTRSYSHVTFHHSEASGWTQRFEPCAMTNTDPRVTFPDSFIDSIPPRTHPITWTGKKYHVDTGASFLGVDGPVPELPRDPDDPHVVDADHDGKPGVTVHLTLPVFGLIELYMAQANHGVLTGELIGEEIRGRVDMKRMETRTLTASVRLFAVNPKVTLVEDASTFRIVKDPQRSCQAAFLPTKEP